MFNKITNIIPVNEIQWGRVVVTIMCELSYTGVWEKTLIPPPRGVYASDGGGDPRPMSDGLDLTITTTTAHPHFQILPRWGGYCSIHYLYPRDPSI